MPPEVRTAQRIAEAITGRGATGRANPLAVMERDAVHGHAYRLAHGVVDATPIELVRESDQARADVVALVEASDRLASRVEFLISDPRAALLDELRAAIKAVKS